LGTEKLQAEIQEKFPGFVVERMDSDTMKRPGSHAKMLSRFRRGEIHVVMGTQMIAKGLDFPNVTLVGRVNADVGLQLPDYRAAGGVPDGADDPEGPGRRAAGGAHPWAGGGAGVPAEGAVPLPLPAAVAEPRGAAPGTPGGAAGGPHAQRGGVHAGCGPARHAV